MKKFTTKLDVIYLAIWIIALQSVGYLMGIITQANLEPWYYHLTKSSLTPPDISFAIVWPILYVLLAIVGFNLFLKKNLCSVRQQTIYSAQLILNWLWSPIFFSLHWPWFALVILGLMVTLTAILIYDLYEQHKKLALLLIPYLVWIVFATYLNGVICMTS
ncbi:MAG: tryptophan-rich sensory protein [Gammaproteobacteria bacterium]|nr:tryptophan-rich sensory protein [Gammaproteobacteria bacterium]